MTFISTGGFNLLDRVTAAKTAHARAASALANANLVAGADNGRSTTRVTLGGNAANSSVYSRPGAVRNDVSSQLALNLNGSGLANRWRGLGGALLNQIAETGTDFKQALSETKPTVGSGDAASATSGASAAEAASGTDEATGILTGATTVKLSVQTRSGQTVELQIASNEGGSGTRGLEVSVTSSGKLSSAEKDALADLADGLDRALDGLGQGTPQLDLSKLMNYDTGVFSGLDLKVENPAGLSPAGAPGSLGSFALHLGADKKSIEMKGPGSDLSISVDATSALGAGGAAQRQSAIQKMLEQIDTAAKRGHADEDLVTNFKTAFVQLQTPSAEQSRQDGGADKGEKSRHLAVSLLVDDEANPSMSPALRDEVGQLRSGLADFDASFSGDSQKTNKYGGVKEQGHAEYVIGQHTNAKPGSTGEGQSITETQTEKLTADFKRSRTLMLDTAGGNFDQTKIRDQKTVTTLIETAKNGISRALRKTDEQQSLVFDSFEKGKSTQHHETPLNRSYVDRLR